MKRHDDDGPKGEPQAGSAGPARRSVAPRQVLDFSEPCFVTGSLFLVLKGSPV